MHFFDLQIFFFWFLYIWKFLILFVFAISPLSSFWPIFEYIYCCCFFVVKKTLINMFASKSTSISMLANVSNCHISPYAIDRSNEVFVERLEFKDCRDYLFNWTSIQEFPVIMHYPCKGHIQVTHSHFTNNLHYLEYSITILPNTTITIYWL